MASQKGMRFWLKSIERRPNVADKNHDSPFGLKDKDADTQYIVAQAEFPEIMYHNKPLMIQGEAFIDDPSVVMALIKAGGKLQFNPQEAVELGYASVESLAAAGYKVKAVDVPKSIKTETKKKGS